MSQLIKRRTSDENLRLFILITGRKEVVLLHLHLPVVGFLQSELTNVSGTEPHQVLIVYVYVVIGGNYQL